MTKIIKEYKNKALTKENIHSLIDTIKESFKDSNIIIWGVGEIGQFYAEFLIKNGIRISCFLDNDANRVDNLFSIPVYLPEEFTNKSKYILLIAARPEAALEIQREIKEKNYPFLNIIDGSECFNFLQECEKRKYWDNVQDCELKPQKEGRLSIPFFELVITNFCTLRCRHCAHFNAHYYFVPEGKKKQQFFKKDEIINTMNKILEGVDEVREIAVVGGEPLLHPELSDILNYLISSEKVKRIEVATNGTMLPKDDVLQALQNEKILVKISVYSDLSKKADELKDLLSKNKIWYRYYFQIQWDDLGEHSYRNKTLENMKKTYNECFDTRYKMILDKKIYDCHRVANAAYLGYYEPAESEFVDIYSYSGLDLKEKIRNLYLNEYIPYCNYCNGKGNHVPAAVQYSSEEIEELRVRHGYDA